MRAFHLTPRIKALITVSYADVFGFPLTMEEFQFWGYKGASTVAKVPELIRKDGYIILRHTSLRIKKRKKRQQWLYEKWKIAKRMAAIISFIPTVALVGVTGGLAMNNSEKEDDIDIFIVVSNGTLWITRFMVTWVSDILRLRRRPKDLNVKNKICLNMFVTERGMRLPTAERDLFSAHEVLQMIPIWEQQGTYKKFLMANRWVRTFLPFAWKEKNKTLVNASRKTPYGVIRFIRIFELPAKFIQLYYMKRRRTNEIISNTTLRFHPKDVRVWIKEKLLSRLIKYHIPLDKIFWAR
jgi:hypothetical protein